ncbi:MAG: adenylate cyclase, partial [Acidimicrobiaceae bacterium]
MKGAEPTWHRDPAVRHTAVVLSIAHAVGAVFTFVYLGWVAPAQQGAGSATGDVLLFLGFGLVAFPATGWLCERVSRRALVWMIDERPPTDAERRATLTLPRGLAACTFLPWAVASVFFGGATAVTGHSAVQVARVALTTFDGGLISCTISFLLMERILRPAIAEVLAGAAPADRPLGGVRLRLLVTWALGSGVPLAGLFLLPLAARDATIRTDIGPAVMVLSVAGMCAGFVITLGNAKAVGEPIDDVRRALQRVREGRLDVEIAVDRAGDLGMLQAGVNDMVEGLRERQRLADLFGRHVGTEVAQRAIEQGSGIESEQREASVLFVDLIGSTALAEVLSPHDVVRTLNAYFDAVVRVVSDEGGWVNKFEGDGALCVFGAPAVQPDHAARALRSARALHSALAALAPAYPGLDAAIGVSSGVVVAGNVGTEQRYEYTLIGR